MIPAEPPEMIGFTNEVYNIEGSSQAPHPEKGKHLAVNVRNVRKPNLLLWSSAALPRFVDSRG
jgi:hypothetical protein